MTLGISSYSFNQYMNAGKLDIFGAIDAAAAIGYRCMDISVVPLRAGETMEQLAPQLRKRAADAGIALSNYAVGGDFLNRPIADEVERLRRELDIAAMLGVKTFRHDATYGYAADYHGDASFETALPRLAEGYAEVTARAKVMGITTCVENHGYFCQDSERIEKLINAVGDANFGALVDIGNFMCADEAPDTAVARVARYAVHAHVKDFLYKPGLLPYPGESWFPTRAGNHLRGTVIMHGVVPVAHCVRLLKQAGYNGAVCVEFEGPEDAMFAAKAAFDNMTGVLAGV